MCEIRYFCEILQAQLLIIIIFDLFIIIYNNLLYIDNSNNN